MNYIDRKVSRRKFAVTITGAGAALALNPFSAWSINGTESEVAGIVAGTIGIDTHSHLDVPFSDMQFVSRNYDLAGELKISGFQAICLTFCVDRPRLTEEGEAYKRFITSLDEIDAILSANNMQRALNYSDVKKAHHDKKPLVVQSVEGSHFIEGNIERLKTAYDRGLRHLGLMHDGQSSPPLGDIYTDQPKYGGLTDYGINVIKECNRLGMLIDLAHCNNEAINDALEITSKPILISHTGLNTQLGNDENSAKMMMPRLISKEQAKTVAHAGGVIGVWTHLAATPLDYAKNIRAMVDVVGTEHVSIGTDTKMAPSPDEKFGQKTNDVWKDSKAGFFYAVVEAMLSIGFSKKEITQIGGGNYWRLFDKATSIG